jgi:predicted chitinase
MNILQASADGFLTGETIGDISRSVRLLNAIKSDIAAIKKVVTPGLKPSTRQNSTAATPSRRDAQGRFVSNNVASPNKQSASTRTQAATAYMPRKIGNVVSPIAGSLTQSDPTAQAAMEITQPIAKGYQLFTGLRDEKQKSLWSRKIFRILSLSHKNDSIYQKATKKTLEEIEDKPTTGGGGSVGNFSIRLVRFLSRSIAKVFSGVARGLSRTLLTVGRLVFGPVGLALGAAATLAWGLFTENGKKFFSDLGRKIAKTWDDAVQVFKNTFPKTAEFIGKITGNVSDGVKKVTEGIADFFKDTVTPETFGLSKETVQGAMDFITGKNSTNKENKNKKSIGNKKTLILGMIDAGIIEPTEQAAFLAQIDHETQGFSRLEENLKYSPSRLRKISGASRGKVAAAIRRGPEGIGELLYGGRKDLGNTVKGDGYKFRGRGFIQLTGRANYAAASKALGINLVDNPDLATDPAIAARIATWFHQKNKKLVNASRGGDIRTARKLVNGGLNGIDDVSQKFSSYLAQTQSNSFRMASLPAQSVTAPSVPAPSLPKAAKANDAPPIVTTLATDAKREKLTVTVNKGDVGQDVSDRRIAHIATGGLSTY